MTHSKTVMESWSSMNVDSHGIIASIVVRSQVFPSEPGQGTTSSGRRHVVGGGLLVCQLCGDKRGKDGV